MAHGSEETEQATAAQSREQCGDYVCVCLGEGGGCRTMLSRETGNKETAKVECFDGKSLVTTRENIPTKNTPL